MSLSIEDAVLPDGRTASVHIEGDRITAIGPARGADETIDARGMALLPGLVNTHTHAAMSLFRGYADDMPLDAWLGTKIWPAEAKLTADDIYWGTKLACLEMIRSGTTCFNDMYFHMDRAAQAVEEMGMRAVLGEGFIDLGDPARAEEQFKAARRVVDRIEAMRSPRIRPALAPHAIYTVSTASLKEMGRWAQERDYRVHIHVGETEKEVLDAEREHGKTPVRVLDELGLLGPNVVAAHAVWLDDAEVATFAERGVHVSHCPVSNMKLAVGRALPMAAMRSAGVSLSLGTDGPASNNTLDMFETMKVTALLHKHAVASATAAAAGDVFTMATAGGARALGIDAGEIAVGKLADLALVDLQRARLTPVHNVVSNLVYAANGSCVDTVVCGGKVLMRAGRVEGEEEILREAATAAARVAGEAGRGA